MGKRLTKIYTRTGDDGTTGLGDGSRTVKEGVRIAAIGNVDELNSAIGRVLADNIPDLVRTLLVQVQHDLFDLGAELSLPGQARVGDDHVTRLEENLDAFNRELPPLKEFILPGGAPAAANAHLARAVARRAERSIVALSRTEPVGDMARKYVNRLSDLLFVIARVLNRAGGRDDVYWKPARPRKPVE